MPNDADTYARNTFSLRGYAKVNKFNFDMSMNFVRKDIRRAESMYMELLQHAVDVDMSSMSDYNDERYNFETSILCMQAIHTGCWTTTTINIKTTVFTVRLKCHTIFFRA